MSSPFDNLKNLSAKGCQATYCCDGGPVWYIRVFPASVLKNVVIENTSNNRRFNIRHFANHYARHTHSGSYPQTLEAILENMRVEKGDDAGVHLPEALKTFDAERLALLGRDDYYVDRIQPYLERVAAAEKPQKVSIVQELYTVLQEPKVMAFTNRNPKFKETMIAKAEELRSLHYLEFPELNRHLEIALDAYGREPKRLPSKNEVVMANFPKLPPNLLIRAEMPTKPHSTPYEGILNGTTVWQRYGYKSEESLAEFLWRFSTNNWLKWPLGDGSVPTAIPEILHHLYSGKQNLYEALLNWTELTKGLLVCKTVEEYKNPEATQNKIVMANFAKLPANLYVHAKTPMFCTPHYGILNGDTIWSPLLEATMFLDGFLAKFSNDNFVQWPMGSSRPTEDVNILHYLYSGSHNLYQVLANWTESSKDLLVCKTKEELKHPELATVLANFAKLPEGISVRIQAWDCVRCDYAILYPSRETLYCHQLRCELSLQVFFDRFIDNNELSMFKTRPTTLKEFLENLYTDKYAVPLYSRLKTWTKGDESKLTMDSPAEMIDRFYSFSPEMEPCACGCGGALEEEVKEEACDCYRCKTESELRSSIQLLEQQLKAAVKRIQLIEEARE
jgi:hypothetical protein